MTERPATSQSIIGNFNVQASGRSTANLNVYQHVVPEPIDEETLAAAQRRLMALPLAAVPGVAPLPPGSRMPYGPNPLFVGRDADLRALAAALKGGETQGVVIAAASGIGGLGKTQLASEFAHRYGRYFAGGVYWLSFADASAIPAQVADCGRPGHIETRVDYSTLPLDDQIRLVLAAWQSPLPRLLIFDNCEDEALLAEWRPRMGGCRVLVTSRRGQWDRTLGVTALPLGVLGRPQSVELLRKHRPDLPPDDADLAAIAAELGGLPLALHLAGSFLERYQRVVTPAAYLAQLRMPELLQHRSLTAGGRSPTSHEQHVARTFAVSYEALEKTKPVEALALALLARAAHFAPGVPVPHDLLLATLPVAGDDPEAAYQAEDALTRLIELGLLEQQTAARQGADGEQETKVRFSLHRLLAAFVHAVAADADAQGAVEQALLERASDLNAAGYPGPLLPLQPHLRTAAGRARHRGDERAAALCAALGHHLYLVGDYAGARPYLEGALAVREAALPEGHPDLAASLNNLGSLLRAQGDYAGARPYLERALAVREAVLPEGHPDLAASLNNLGALLHRQGDYAGARPYYERALAVREAVLPEGHPDLAASLNNLGLLLRDQGDYAGARPYLERALAVREAALPEGHPDLAASLNNLGSLLQAQGDYAGARPYLERALAIWGAALPEGHPDLAASLNNLGLLLRDQGDYAGARPYLERALAIREAALPEGHPDTAASLNNLGLLLRDQGDYAGARPYLERALAICELRFGRDHPSTRIVQANLQALDTA